jgi:hypothetical protein
MPRSKTTAEPDVVYECIASFFKSPDGYAVLTREGSRCSVPAGRLPENPQYWVRFGSDDATILRARTALLGRISEPVEDEPGAGPFPAQTASRPSVR